MVNSWEHVVARLWLFCQQSRVRLAGQDAVGIFKVQTGVGSFNGQGAAPLTVLAGPALVRSSKATGPPTGPPTSQEASRVTRGGVVGVKEAGLWAQWCYPP